MQSAGTGVRVGVGVARGVGVGVSVPVGVGQPTLKVDDLTVGGTQA